MQIADFLVANDVKMIVIACNTVSATCLDDLQFRYPNIPILGIIRPAAKKIARSCALDSRIGIIGTKVTIRSKAYEQAIHECNPDLQVYSVPCPAFVPLIEEGIIQSDIMDLTIRYYLDDFILENRLNTLVLGCTHYPLIRGGVERIYPDLIIVNPSEEIVHSIKNELREKNMFAKDSSFENTFYASDLSENFINMINRIFEGSDVNVLFKNLELESVIAERREKDEC